MSVGRRPPGVDRAVSELPDEPAIADSILEAVRSVRYGSVEVVIHDARVVQIVRTEKLRIDR